VDDLASIAARHETAPEPAWLWDAERRRVLWANAPALALFGAESLFDLIERSFASDAPEARAAAHTGERVEAALAPLGLPIHATIDVSALHLSHAKFARLIVVRAVKPAPADPAAARRAALFEFAPMALLYCSLDGVVMEANAASSVVAGPGLNHLADLLDEDKAKRIVARALAQGHASETAERRGRFLRASALRVADPVEGGAALLVMVHDVTARRDIELMMRGAMPAVPQAPAAAVPGLGALQAAEGARDEALRKSAAKSEFIGKLSHEMRNPLNAIIGFAEIMQQGHFGPLPDRYRGYADDIRASADHLLSLTEDLLDVARVEAGHLTVRPEQIALAPIIEECVRLLRPTADRYDVALTAETGTLPPVMADPRSVRQILINLISNALKFTPAGGAVRVTAAPDSDGGVRVTVADTGIGMTAGDMKVALEPFGQVEGEHQKERKGAGLGLPLAKSLAEANRAAFGIASEKGKGTTIRVTFAPASTPAAPPGNVDAGDHGDADWMGTCRLGP
jgi:signal transduction histidine kinase